MMYFFAGKNIGQRRFVVYNCVYLAKYARLSSVVNKKVGFYYLMFMRVSCNFV